ncbi:GPO family capsid scaffolding protein, partial [Citrobacter freundii]|uniref:GPO family capsid scaffolding protein n=1 Tax=Citrobacter freundii TaxID=546 RepID=UPI000A4ED082
MAKKVSKFFRIGVEGDTCDGRIISGNDIQEMAESFDPRVYGCRINLEHIRGLFPDGDFKRLGDVVELKAEKIDDDSALNGKWALFAKITPTDDLIAMNKKLQKVYTSMEIQPNFANTGKCYLVGLAVTDDPKPQKQKVTLKRKPKEKHLRALEHPKAKPVSKKTKAKKEQEAREGEYMAGEADNVLALTTVYASKAQAMRAAQAKWDKLQRGVAEFSITLALGRADLFPETPVRVSGFKRVIDEQAWLISKVTHNLNNNGFTTGLELEVKLSDVEY